MRMLNISGGFVIVTAAILMLLVFLFRPGVATGAPADDAAAVFKTRCAPCHGPQGDASTPAAKNLKLKDLKSPEVQKKSDAELEQIVAKGSKNMPGFEKSLGAEKVKAQVAYIRSLAKK